MCDAGLRWSSRTKRSRTPGKLQRFRFLLSKKCWNLVEKNLEFEVPESFGKKGVVAQWSGWFPCLRSLGKLAILQFLQLHPFETFGYLTYLTTRRTEFFPLSIYLRLQTCIISSFSTWVSRVELLELPELCEAKKLSEAKTVPKNRSCVIGCICFLDLVILCLVTSYNLVSWIIVSICAFDSSRRFMTMSNILEHWKAWFSTFWDRRKELERRERKLVKV